ncbi:aromatic ring-hydroxylating dioxygenase subunit alpha [Ottowia thiooxydans]|uniref:Nitrite reductase/ring-hydroxylating ferredoxin subunit n=1 Tax=Ottowia thiooxydans TaxID=219182 RepID=A0ABV2Q452_9BURK
MEVESKPVFMGSLYGKKPGKHIPEITEVSQGTPMGELLRRYWQPVALAKEATTTPKLIQVFGEELILFRDKSGRPGLVHPRCAHRGTSLIYGKVEERGIRCCYHGWLFDVEGKCVEQPCEPNNGEHRSKVRQPWYPVQDAYDLVFAYMGPPEKMPILPRVEALEGINADQKILGEQKAFASGGPAIADCNWLQYFENALDTFHVSVLHSNFSGLQFIPEMAVMPNVEWSLTKLGVKATQKRVLPDGRLFLRVTEALAPNVRSVPDAFGKNGPVDRIEWTIPVDDTHFTTFTAGVVHQDATVIRERRVLHDGKLWEDMTEEEHRAFPDDREAQVGQGPITWHTDEHLVTSDVGLVMFRRLLQRQLAVVAAGNDPLGVWRNKEEAVIQLEAGNFFDAQ